MEHSFSNAPFSQSGPPSSTSASLLQRVRTQDADAWRRLVDLYAPLIYGWCARTGLRAEDVGDVVQDVFASVAASIGDFEREGRRGRFRAWLHGITRHRISDHFRRRPGGLSAKGGTEAQQQILQVPEAEQPSSPTDGPPVEHPVWRRATEMVRAEFEDRTWRAFWRVAVDGQSPAQVAEELGMGVHAVYKAKSRVLRRLRQELADLEGRENENPRNGSAGHASTSAKTQSELQPKARAEHYRPRWGRFRTSFAGS